MLIHSGTDSNTGAALFQQYNIETGLTSMIVSPNSDFAAPARQHHSMGIDQATGQVYLHGGIAADSGLWTVKVRGGTIVRGDYNNCSGNKKSKVDAIANNVNAQTNARCTAQRSRQEERMQMFLGEFMCKDQTSVSVSPQRSCLQNYLKDGTMDWNAFKITLNSELKRQGGQWVCPAKEIAMAWTDVDFAAFKAKLDGTQFGKAVINAIDLVCPTRQGRRLGGTIWGLTSNTSTSLWTNDNSLWSQDLWEDHKGTQMSQAANNDVNGQGSCDKGELDPIIAVCFHRDSTVLVPTSNGQFQIRLMQDLRAGDKVMVMDERTGQVSIDRVSINLHLKDSSVSYNGITLHHEFGHLSVTDGHVVMINGVPMPAREAKLGDALQLVDASDMRAGKSISAQVTRISRWQGGIINPLTHSGRILAGPVAVNSTFTPPYGGVFTAAATVIDSPYHVQLLVTSLPGLLKLASILFPSQLQRSALVERSIMSVCWVSAELKGVMSKTQFGTVSMAFEVIAWAISLLLFLVVDLVVGGCCLIYYGFVPISASVAASCSMVCIGWNAGVPAAGMLGRGV
jgi:hypothetical protein